MKDHNLPRYRPAFLRFTSRAEEAILCLLLLSMIGLACLQIILRSGFSSGLLWADPLIRYLVLWSGLLGAAMATSRGKHIALDVGVHLIPRRLYPWIRLLTHLFSTVVAAGLTWSAYLFIRSEIEYGGPGLFDVPTWYWNLIFPLAFVLITFRYLILFLSTAFRLFGLGVRPLAPK